MPHGSRQMPADSGLSDSEAISSRENSRRNVFTHLFDPCRERRVFVRLRPTSGDEFVNERNPFRQQPEGRHRVEKIVLLLVHVIDASARDRHL